MISVEYMIIVILSFFKQKAAKILYSWQVGYFTDANAEVFGF